MDVRKRLGITNTMVDDAIHLLHKYDEGVSKGNARGEALYYVFSYAGKTMLYTTISLVGVFLILALSGFELNTRLGAFTRLNLASASTFDL